jgi:hypothetical protein
MNTTEDVLTPKHEEGQLQPAFDPLPRRASRIEQLDVSSGVTEEAGQRRVADFTTSLPVDGLVVYLMTGRPSTISIVL